jgi:hypothetical protein
MSLLDAIIPPQQQTAAGLLGPLPQGAAPGAPGAPGTPLVDPLTATNAWAMAQNKAAYGTDDPAKLGMLGSAGFPLMSDPRMVQDHLAQLAQGTITQPGVSQAAAEDEFWRQLRGRGGGWGTGSGWGGGEGEMGTGGGGAGASGGGAGQDASGQW